MSYGIEGTSDDALEKVVRSTLDAVIKEEIMDSEMRSALVEQVLARALEEKVNLPEMVAVQIEKLIESASEEMMAKALTFLKANFGYILLSGVARALATNESVTRDIRYADRDKWIKGRTKEMLFKAQRDE